MPKAKMADSSPVRRTFTDAFRREAVQMLLDGHSAKSIADGTASTANLCDML